MKIHKTKSLKIILAFLFSKIYAYNKAYNTVYCTMDADYPSPLHIAMYPWFAMGHLTPFLHLANKLAKRGHKISVITPKRTQLKLKNLNLNPTLITFVPINVPNVDGLPHDAETTSDVPSKEFESIEEALPKGFKERVQERGIVHGSWVQQQLILAHPSVGCFTTHCGGASLTEALVNKCQLVLLPRLGSDFIINARTMSGKLRVGVEVEKGEEDGLFTKESVCKAVEIVMDDENELGREVRENHNKVRSLFLSNSFESSCLDAFCHRLQDLIF